MKKKKPDGFSILILGICLLFYLFFAAYDGAVICVDSPSYIHMETSREPFYPMLLALLRMIFSFAPEGFYLEVVAFLQSILAAAAAFILTQYIRKEFSLSRIFSLCVLAMPLAVSLLCRFAARRGSMYSNSILTEGIALSLYMIFFRFLLEYYYYQTGKSLMLSGCIVFLLLSTRKQMAIALFMLAFVILAVGFKSRKMKRAILSLLLVSVLSAGGSMLFDLCYNYALRGEAVTHSSDVRFVSTIAFYTARREDAQWIKDDGTKELFLRIYDICDANGYLKNSAQEGWSNRVAHFGDNYDLIQIDTMWPEVNNFVAQEYGYEGVLLSGKADEIMQDINLAILPHHIGSVAEVFMDNFRSGLVTTVAQRNHWLNYYSIFIYFFYFAVLAWTIRRDKKIAGFAILVILSVVLNVGLCSLVIFCQTRYTIYNMALFYMSILVMLSAFWKRKKEKTRQIAGEKV